MPSDQERWRQMAEAYLQDTQRASSHARDAMGYAAYAANWGAGNLRTPRPAYASDPRIIEGEFKVVKS